MKDKVALVTGAGAGIGRATALAFAREGASVVAADINFGGAKETAELITKKKGKALPLEVDISSSRQIREMIERTIKEYGRLDYACNNAGIEGDQAFIDASTEKNWNRVISVNLTGVWSCMKHEIPYLKKQGGAIVNIASVAGMVGFAGISAYVASKHGVTGLTKTAALEYAKNDIRVNSICPGVIETPMIERFFKENPEGYQQMIDTHPLGRFGKPEEVANAVVWLCSDQASFITGIVMAVDGGYTVQ